MEQKHVHRLSVIENLKGKSASHVLALLGSPRVIDTTSSRSERIWGYYQVAVKSDDNEEPRQRTVLIVMRTRDAVLIVDEVRVP